MAIIIDLCGQITRKEKENLDSLLSSLYQEKLDSIATQYKSGGLPWLKENRPELSRNICRTWDKLNEIWNLCLDGKAEEQDFKSILNEWYRFQLKGIKAYEEKPCKIIQMSI